MPAEKKTQRYTFKGAAGEYVYAADFDRVTAERDALQELLNQRDEAIHDLEQRRHAELQACQAAERRVEELLDTARGLIIQAHASWGFTEHHPDCIRDLAALNLATEAASHE